MTGPNVGRTAPQALGPLSHPQATHLPQGFTTKYETEPQGGRPSVLAAQDPSPLDTSLSSPHSAPPSHPLKFPRTLRLPF